MTRTTRRQFLVLGVAGLFAAACGAKAEPVTRRGKPEPTAVPASVPQPTPRAEGITQPAPAVGAVQTGPVSPQFGPAPLGASRPALAGPIVAQNLVIPAPPRAPGPYLNRVAPPERVIIPTIELDAKVVSITTRNDKDGKLVWETAPFAAGHHRGSGMPGEVGNVVLSGHISSRSEGAVFSRLPHVKPGDGVVVVTAERHHLYKIVDTKVVSPDAVEVIDRTDASVATLITCVPDGVYTHRLVVRAEAV